MSSAAALTPGVPPTEHPLFHAIKHELGWDPETLRIAEALHEQGYAIIDFPDEDFDARAARVVRSLTPFFDFDRWRQTEWARGDGLRIQDAWTSNDDVRALAAHPAILDLLSRLYGRRALPFQTLNFPVGTQQHYHTDAVHFSSAPERFMVGVWVALEDIHEDAGPLVYFPGSHRLPILTNEHLGVIAKGPDDTYAHGAHYLAMWRSLVEGLALQPLRFCARKGQALIWAANLLHGGDLHRDPQRTRWSQVTHYYFDGCAYFTPFITDAFFGRIGFRQGMIDIATGKPLTNRYCGREVPADFIRRTAWTNKSLGWRIGRRIKAALQGGGRS